MISKNGGPLHVGIEATPMLVAQRTGIENYTAALVRALADLSSQETAFELVAYLHIGNPFVGQARVAEAIQVLRRCGVKHRLYTPRRAYGLALPLFATWNRLDLIHYPRITQPWFQACPYVVTVHDVKAVGLSDEGVRIEQAETTARERTVIQRAAGLICVSESTKRDLMKAFELDGAQPIQVIHEGLDPAYFNGHHKQAGVGQKYNLDRYIFFIGTLQYRKNLPRLIEAFARLKQSRGIPHKLVLAGRDGWGADLVYAAVVEHGVEDEVLFPGYVPDEDLPGLYAGADVFAYPSLHEGFGIPLLEAMASGTVVLTSDQFSMPEVAGDAAVYVSPHDVDDIAAGLWRAINDDTLRCELVAKGKTRAKQFTWRQTAANTMEFYHAVSGLGGRHDPR